MNLFEIYLYVCECECLGKLKDEQKENKFHFQKFHFLYLPFVFVLLVKEIVKTFLMRKLCFLHASELDENKTETEEAAIDDE